MRSLKLSLKMKKITEAKEILKHLGLEEQQQNDLAAYTLLALANLRPKSAWTKATRQSMKVTKDIMKFVAVIYKKVYAPNTRETFRRQVLHQLTLAGVTQYNPDNPNLPVNSPNAHYALSNEALAVIKSYGTANFNKQSKAFRAALTKRQAQFQTARNFNRIPLRLPNGTEITLSPGAHNQVEAAVVTEFGPRFANGASVLYLGDTENKDIIFEKKTLVELGCKLDDHGKFPDVILYLKNKNWLYLIEAITSHGPVSQKRVTELKQMFPTKKLGLIFVSAFPNMTEFKKHAKDIAWDTEVWLADMPDHLIHFNGDRFMGPR